MQDVGGLRDIDRAGHAGLEGGYAVPDFGAAGQAGAGHQGRLEDAVLGEQRRERVGIAGDGARVHVTLEDFAV
ncbi:hypothetical protein Ari01nite_82800 [Paractinoplanes rishiriensis]|uniref:Uncharacterized protein n=1 Tax=Paractinoplanes rishiriensis TaxID=1050105 RepID=A0A919K4T0_9ACTN|nr:hypothetical protein Ari01nite_82800 [Actinoplanes rishiriensis]